MESHYRVEVKAQWREEWSKFRPITTRCVSAKTLPKSTKISINSFIFLFLNKIFSIKFYFN